MSRSGKAVHAIRAKTMHAIRYKPVRNELPAEYPFASVRRRLRLNVFEGIRMAPDEWRPIGLMRQVNGLNRFNVSKCVPSVVTPLKQNRITFCASYVFICFFTSFRIGLTGTLTFLFCFKTVWILYLFVYFCVSYCIIAS